MIPALVLVPVPPVLHQLPAGFGCSAASSRNSRATNRPGAAPLVLHEVLVEVDAEERADDLAGGHPPGEEGEEASEENGGEDGAQGGEGLRQAGHGGLDVLLRLLHGVFVIVQAAVGDGRCGGHDQGRGHPGARVCAASPGEIPYTVSTVSTRSSSLMETTDERLDSPRALRASVEKRMRKTGTKYWRVTTVR